MPIFLPARELTPPLRADKPHLSAAAEGTQTTRGRAKRRLEQTFESTFNIAEWPILRATKPRSYDAGHMRRRSPTKTDSRPTRAPRAVEVSAESIYIPVADRGRT